MDTHALDTHALATIDTAGIGRLQTLGIYGAGAGLVVGGLGVAFQPAQLAPSLLIGFWFCIGLSLGCLSLLMMQHMTGGQWGLVSRRIYEAGARLLPFCLLLFVPIVVLLPKLYIWAQPDVVAADEILKLKAPYLNPTWFVIRAVIYFAVWLFCMWNLDRWSTAQDRGELGVTEADTRRFRVISAPGLVVYVILMSLAAVDWTMSLDPHWYSTIYGLIQVVGQGISALAFGVAVLALIAPREPMNHVLRASQFHDLGKLLLAFVMLYAYFSFSQFLIIWAGNLPEEIPYYLERLHNGWQPVTIFLVVGHFFLPFCLLLSRDLKRRPNLLARVAWFIVAIRLLTDIWLVAPAFNQSGVPISLANVGIPLFFGGVWVWLFAQQLGKRPLLPINDPYFKDMLLHGDEGGH
jgi:hypothetical protein